MPFPKGKNWITPSLLYRESCISINFFHMEEVIKAKQTSFDAIKKARLEKKKADSRRLFVVA